MKKLFQVLYSFDQYKSIDFHMMRDVTHEENPHMFDREALTIENALKAKGRTLFDTIVQAFDEREAQYIVLKRYEVRK